METLASPQTPTPEDEQTQAVQIAQHLAGSAEQAQGQETTQRPDSFYKSLGDTAIARVRGEDVAIPAPKSFTQRRFAARTAKKAARIDHARRQLESKQIVYGTDKIVKGASLPRAVAIKAGQKRAIKAAYRKGEISADEYVARRRALKHTNKYDIFVEKKSDPIKRSQREIWKSGFSLAKNAVKAKAIGSASNGISNAAIRSREWLIGNGEDKEGKLTSGKKRAKKFGQSALVAAAVRVGSVTPSGAESLRWVDDIEALKRRNSLSVDAAGNAVVDEPDTHANQPLANTGLEHDTPQAIPLHEPANPGHDEYDFEDTSGRQGEYRAGSHISELQDEMVGRIEEILEQVKQQVGEANYDEAVALERANALVMAEYADRIAEAYQKDMGGFGGSINSEDMIKDAMGEGKAETEAPVATKQSAARKKTKRQTKAPAKKRNERTVALEYLGKELGIEPASAETDEERREREKYEAGNKALDELRGYIND